MGVLLARKSQSDYFLDDVHHHRINRNNFSIYIGGDPSHMGNEGDEPGVDYSMADRFELNLDILSSIDKSSIVFNSTISKVYDDKPLNKLSLPVIRVYNDLYG